MIKNFLASVAAAGLLFAPIAAQAGTRAANAGVSMSALARASAPVGSAEYQAEEDEAGWGIDTVWVIVGFAIVAAAIVASIESGENNKSPGT